MKSKGRKRPLRHWSTTAGAPDAKHKGRLSKTLISSDVLGIFFFVSFPQPINYFLRGGVKHPFSSPVSNSDNDNNFWKPIKGS